MKKEHQLIGAIRLIALLGSKKYEICEKDEADYFASVKFWDKDDEDLRGDFQVFIKLTPISSMKKEKRIKAWAIFFRQYFVSVCKTKKEAEQMIRVDPLGYKIIPCEIHFIETPSS